MTAMEMIAATRAKRAANGLVAMTGEACATKEWVNYINARNLAPRTAAGFATVKPSLEKLRADAIASTGYDIGNY